MFQSNHYYVSGGFSENSSIWHGKIRNLRLCGGAGCYVENAQDNELELLIQFNSNDNKILNKKEVTVVIKDEEVFG